MPLSTGHIQVNRTRWKKNSKFRRKIPVSYTKDENHDTLDEKKKKKKQATPAISVKSKLGYSMDL